MANKQSLAEQIKRECHQEGIESKNESKELKFKSKVPYTTFICDRPIQ
jgi:hypothetical protein